MKICAKCNTSKEDTEFYTTSQKGKNSIKLTYLDNYCKKCRLDYSSERFLNIKIQAIEYLGGKCNMCGLIDLPCIYDFHHLNPSEKEISFGSRGGRTFKTLKSELDKCELLCSNCHRKKHSTQ